MAKAAKKGYSVICKEKDLITDKVKLQDAIKEAQSKGRSYERALHRVACSCLHHVDQHGNIGPIVQLIDGLNKSARKNALIDWAVEHGKLRWDKEAKTLKFDKHSEANVAGAMVTPFWDFKPEPPYKPIDLEEAIMKLVERAEKRIEKWAAEGEGEMPDAIDPAMIQKLKNICAGTDDESEVL